VTYPADGRIGRLRMFRKFVADNAVDWVMTATETSLAMPVALKFLNRVRIAVDLHGVLAEEARATNAVGPFQYRSLKYRIWSLLCFYDRVFPVSDKLTGYYAPVSDRIRWIPIYGGVDAALPEQMPAGPGDGKTFRIGYMGNARAYQGLPYILDAAAALRGGGVPVRLNLIISGDGETVRADLKERGLTDVTDLRCDVSHDTANDLIRNSDVLSIPRPGTPVTEFAFPSKLPEYLATGIPVIITDVGPVGELKDVLREAAIVIGTDDIAANLAAAFAQVYEMDNAARADLGERARGVVAREFTWPVLGAKLCGALNR
tara:strand:- start:178 stop:1128 length:951 start_codon:yes stop_codon:yes gene_type:complete